MVPENSPAIFLDKDGTLIEDRPFNVDPQLIEFAPGAEAALRAFARRGYKIIIVTNQSGVARGYFQEPRIRDVEDRLRVMIRAAGANLDGFYYCPHHPEGCVPEYARTCLCRKPEPGMILRAAEEHGVDLSRSWFIGDILHDVEAGRRAGVRTILIDNGNETEWEIGPVRTPHFMAPDLWEAARIIIKEEKDVHEQLERFEPHTLREIGFDGGRLDDGTGDPRPQGVQSESSHRSSDVPVGG